MTVFVIKHKTAYEVRICDWSSDVCSSDLRGSFAFSHAWGPSTRQSLMLTAAASPQAKILTFFRRDAYAHVYAKEVDMARKKSDSTPPREAKLLDRKSTRLNSSH